MALTTVVQKNAVDTWAANVAPLSTVRGNETQLGLGDGWIFIWFSNPAPRDARIVSAKMRLYTLGSWGGAGPTLTTQLVSAKYSRSTLNWNNKPGVVALPAPTKTQGSTGDLNLWEIDVTSIMQAVADGAPWYGMCIKSSQSTPRRFRSSRNYGSGGRPELEMTWVTAPAKPTRLTPSGGQAVNATKPVLEMDYTDPSGTTTLAALQVQVDPAANFVFPAFDSGTVIATGSVARIDLATTAYAGLAEGASASWRGRVRDSSGEWSDWSDVASWSRTAKGVVTITSPSSGTPTVQDFTPPVTWTFSKTQTKWHVIVTDPAGAVVYSSGERAGTDSAATVVAPSGAAVLSQGVTYTLEVRCWDNQDRIGTVGDPAYSVATRNFTVVPSAGVGPISSLVATPTTPQPGLALTWARAAGAPDAFTILRDGKAVVTNLPVAQAVSGGAYAYTITNMRPNIAQQISVSAIVNGVASVPVVISATPKVGGLWLFDTADPTIYLPLANTSGSSFNLGEDGETVVPLGAREGIRITQGLRGYEGTVTGTIISEWGKTKDQWYEIALLMRSRPGRTYRMIVGTEVFDCVIWNMNPRPTGDSSPTMRQISFEYMQVGASRVTTVL